MTTLTAGPNGFIMSGASALFSTNVVSVTATPTQITEGLSNGDSEILTGSFQVSNGQLTGGTGTGYALYQGSNHLLFSLSNDTVAVSTFEAYENSNNITGLAHYLLSGHDTYIGSAATDLLVGYGGNDTFVGGSGTESFETAAGVNTITGGSGADTVIFQGPSSAYTIADNGNGNLTVTDSVASRNGVDHLANIQFLQFTDKTMFELTATEAKVALLYQGALGRTPDAPGLVGWEKAFATESAATQNSDNFTALAGTPVSGLPDLAYGFTQSTEFQTKYGALTDTQFVTQLYANVLDRTPDASGLNGWVAALGQGHTREWVLVGFVESAEAYNNAEVGYVGQTGTVHAAWLTLI